MECGKQCQTDLAQATSNPRRCGVNIQQLRELVGWSAQFHHSLAGQYAELAESAEPRLRLLLDYLSDHEREAERGLQRHLQEHGDALDGQWLRVGAEVEAPDLLDQQKSVLCGTSADDVVDQAVRIHQQLKQMYANLADLAELPESRDLLVALRDHEDAEARRMVRDVGRFDMC